MKFNIKLKDHKNKFCKKCLSQLKGKTRVGKVFKAITCENCQHLNKFKMQSANR